MYHNLRIFLGLLVAMIGAFVGWDQQQPLATFAGILIGVIIGYDSENNLPDDLH